MVETHEFVDSTMEDRVKNMIRDVGVQNFVKVVCESMTTNVETPLYPGSTNFTQLSTVLRLINLKALNGWIDKSFTRIALVVERNAS